MAPVEATIGILDGRYNTAERTVELPGSVAFTRLPDGHTLIAASPEAGELLWKTLSYPDTIGLRSLEASGDDDLLHVTPDGSVLETGRTDFHPSVKPSGLEILPPLPPAPEITAPEEPAPRRGLGRVTGPLVSFAKKVTGGLGGNTA